MPEPDVGDRVLARLRPAPEGDYLARPMRVLDPGLRRVVGVFRADGRGGGAIQPADLRALPLVTIDGAVWAEADPAADNPGG